MYIYIICLCLSLLIFIISNKIRNNTVRRVLRYFIILPFILVSAIRFNVGSDFYNRYLLDFYKIANGFDVENIEIGFKIFIKFCLMLSNNSQILFILTSFIVNFFVCYAINKYSKNIPLSIFIYLFGGFFFFSMNGIRQFWAMSIILSSYEFVNKTRKDKIFFLFILCLASLIHESALVFLILVFIPKVIITNYKLQFYLVSMLSIVLTFFGDKLFILLGKIMSFTRFNVYFVGYYARGEISWLYLFVNFAIYLFFFLNFKKNKDNNYKNYFIIQAFALLFTSAQSIHMLFSRISYYFTIFQILSVPFFLEKFNYNGKIINRTKLKFLVVICYMLLLFYTNIINNDNQPLPYHTYFEYI